jgi:hypothetical protein
LRMAETSPETIVFREANYINWRFLMNENFDTIVFGWIPSQFGLEEQINLPRKVLVFNSNMLEKCQFTN